MGSSYYQETTAIEKLRQMFPDPETVEMTPEQILETVGKTPVDRKSRQWLRDTLRSMGIYNFVEKVVERTPSGADKIKTVKLTPAGMKALRPTRGADSSYRPAEQPSNQQLVNLEQVYRDIRLLRKQLPSFNVVFEVTPKEQV